MRDIRYPGRRFDLGLGWFRRAKRRDDEPPSVEHLGGGAGFSLSEPAAVANLALTDTR
jgi:hypothetical protein